MSAKKLYVIGNSHMDPIWLWRLREGRSTWLNTCRSVVRMMRKYPFLKFCRSSSACYGWIESCDPALFGEIRQLVEEGRWELVGGWVEQSDTIITSGEILLRQAEYGKRYFREKFGRDVRIGYSVDAFGQNAGLPKLLKTGGFDRYVFMRPMEHEKSMPDLFRWRGDDGSLVTAFRIKQAYCTMPDWTKKEQLFDWIDRLIETGAEYQTFFFGIGDHGGGFFERQIEWLLEAARTRPLEFSTLSHYFDVIEKTELPVVEGELTHHSPGCYSAVGSIKRDLAATERNLLKAEKILQEAPGPDGDADRARLDAAWNRYLFNYFHDIYPGTSIRAAYEQEVRDLTGAANLAATDILEKRLARYGATVKSDFLTEGGVLLWNPLPRPVRAVMSFDTWPDPNKNGRDFNVLRDAAGNMVPLEWLRAAASFGPFGTWGRATAVVDLPASGLRIFAWSYGDAAGKKLGFDRQRAALERFTFPVLADPYDTWGHGAPRLGDTVGSAELTACDEMADGAVASWLRAAYRWKNSTFKLDLIAYAGIPELFIRWSADWREPDETVKISLQTGIPSGTIVSGQALAVLKRRPDENEQPFIDWVVAADKTGTAGFIAGSLHGYDSFGSGELRLTLNRPVHYAEHAPNPPHGDEGYADLGEVIREFWFSAGRPAEELPAIAQERLMEAERFEITAASDGNALYRPEWKIEPPELPVTAQRGGAFRLWNPANRPRGFRLFRDGVERASGELFPNEVREVVLEQE